MPADTAAAARGTAPSHESFAQARMRPRLIHDQPQLPDFGSKGGPAAVGQLVIPPLRLLPVHRLFAVRLGNQAGFFEPLDRFVEGAGTEPDFAFASGFDVLFDRVAVLRAAGRSEEHTSELQSQSNLVCRLLLEKKKKNI